MSKKVLKTVIKEAFEAPPPVKKEEFLQKFQYENYLSEIKQPSITLTAFVLVQVIYIRKWIWLLDVCVFVAALFGAVCIEQDMLWCISAMTPSLALALTTENGRSENYGMAEFEMASRFSLRSVILARLGILGFTDFILLCLMLPLGSFHSGRSLVQTGICMLCPYMLTAFLGLWATRVVHSRESVYLCMAIALFVSWGCIFLQLVSPIYYDKQYFSWWFGGGLLFFAGAIMELRKGKAFKGGLYGIDS